MSDDQSISDLTPIDALSAVVKTMILSLPVGVFDEHEFVSTLRDLQTRMENRGVAADVIDIIKSFIALVDPSEPEPELSGKPPWLRGVFDGIRRPQE